MVEIIPAVLPKTFEELEDGLSRLRGISPFVQIDLVGQNVLAGLEYIPFWEEFDFEADIMLPHPAQEVRQCIDAGASRIVVHAAAEGAKEALAMLQETREGDFAIKAGLALASDAGPEALDDFAGMYDYVQVMGIAHIGRQGEPFDERALAAVEALRAAHPDLLLQVDGAAATHVRELVRAGANRLVVGSAIIHVQDPEAAYKALYTEANVAQ